MFYMVLIDENHDLYPKNDENGPKSRLYDVIMASKSLFFKKKFSENFRKKMSNMIGYVIFSIFKVTGVKIAKNSHFGRFSHTPLYISA